LFSLKGGAEFSEFKVKNTKLLPAHSMLGFNTTYSGAANLVENDDKKHKAKANIALALC